MSDKHRRFRFGDNPRIVPGDGDDAHRTIRWTRYMHRKLVREGRELLFSVDENGDPTALDLEARFHRETFSRMYDRDDPITDSPNTWSTRLHSLAEEVREYRELQARCQGDAVFSFAAAQAIGDEVIPAASPERDLGDLRSLQDELRGLQQMAEMAPDHPEVSDALESAEKALAESQAAHAAHAAGLNESAMRNALRAAVGKAKDSIEAQQEACAAFGWGSDTAGLQAVSTEKRMALASMLAKDERLRRIVMQAGRMIRFAGTKRASRTTVQTNEVESVEVGNAIARALPSELALLGDTDLDSVFWSRFSNRELLQLSMRADEAKQRGPFVVMQDVSGSMSGARDEWAKAVALAVMNDAHADGRDFAFCLFNGSVVHAETIRPGDPQAGDKMLAFIAQGCGGGTSWDAATAWARGVIGGDLPDADAVLISDGECSMSPGARSAWDSFRAERGVHSYGVLVGGTPVAMKQICDECWGLNGNLGGDTPALDMIFGQ